MTRRRLHSLPTQGKGPSHNVPADMEDILNDLEGDITAARCLSAVRLAAVASGKTEKSILFSPNVLVFCANWDGTCPSKKHQAFGQYFPKIEDYVADKAKAFLSERFPDKNLAASLWRRAKKLLSLAREFHCLVFLCYHDCFEDRKETLETEIEGLFVAKLGCVVGEDKLRAATEKIVKEHHKRRPLSPQSVLGKRKPEWEWPGRDGYSRSRGAPLKGQRVSYKKPHTDWQDRANKLVSDTAEFVQELVDDSLISKDRFSLHCDPLGYVKAILEEELVVEVGSGLGCAGDQASVDGETRFAFLLGLILADGDRLGGGTLDMRKCHLDCLRVLKAKGMLSSAVLGRTKPDTIGPVLASTGVKDPKGRKAGYLIGVSKLWMENKMDDGTIKSVKGLGTEGAAVYLRAVRGEVSLGDYALQFLVATGLVSYEDRFLRASTKDSRKDLINVDITKVRLAIQDVTRSVATWLGPEGAMALTKIEVLMHHLDQPDLHWYNNEKLTLRREVFDKASLGRREVIGRCMDYMDSAGGCDWRLPNRVRDPLFRHMLRLPDGEELSCVDNEMRKILSVRSTTKGTSAFDTGASRAGRLASMLRPGSCNYQTKNHRVTPLMVLALTGDRESIKDCLELGADPTLHSSKGWNALHFAAKSNQEGAAVILAQRNPECLLHTDEDGRTPSQLAYHKGHTELGKLLRQLQEG